MTSLMRWEREQISTRKLENVEEKESWRCFKKLSKDVKAFKCPTKFFSGKKPFFQQLDEKEEKIEQSWTSFSDRRGFESRRRLNLLSFAWRERAGSWSAPSWRSSRPCWSRSPSGSSPRSRTSPWCHSPGKNPLKHIGIRPSYPSLLFPNQSALIRLADEQSCWLVWLT